MFSHVQSLPSLHTHTHTHTLIAPQDLAKLLVYVASILEGGFGHDDEEEILDISNDFRLFPNNVDAHI